MVGFPRNSEGNILLATRHLDYKLCFLQKCPGPGESRDRIFAQACFLYVKMPGSPNRYTQAHRWVATAVFKRLSFVSVLGHLLVLKIRVFSYHIVGSPILDLKQLSKQNRIHYLPGYFLILSTDQVRSYPHQHLLPVVFFFFVRSIGSPSE